VQQALYWDEHLPGLPCVYVITTSGCVLQGDRLDISVTVSSGAMAHVTTQSATKIHQMDANFAAQTQRLALADNAYLELLPGPVIPHRHSRFITHTRATVAETATLLNVELLQPGRKHYGPGELSEFDLYSSTLTASRPEGTPLFTEKLVAEPWRHPVRQAGVMGKFDVLANVTLVTPRRHADQIFEKIIPGADTSADCVAGASRLPNDAWGRPMSQRWVTARNRGMPGKRFWAGTAVSATHCGAGCVLGDLIAEWVVFAASLQLLGFALPVEYPLDYVLALSWGILFQYFVITPMRHLAFGKGLKLAAKADFLALSAFEVGLFGWMAIMQLVLFPSPHLTTDHAAFWFLMQVGMIIGFATTYPMNWWLIRHGIKEVM
jgi:urease accessory protein UreH